MEVITSGRDIPPKSMIGEEAIDMQRKLIYTDIWHYLSVSCVSLVAVVIFMFLVTVSIYAIIFLISSTNRLIFIKMFENLESVRKQCITFEEQEHNLSKRMMVPSGVSEDNLCNVNDSRVFFKYGYSSNNFPVVPVEHEDNSYSYTSMKDGTLNWEDEIGLDELDEKNNSLSLKCKPDQELQSINVMNYSRNSDNNVLNRQCEQDRNCNSTEYHSDKVKNSYCCTERSVSFCEQQENNSENTDVNLVAENKFFPHLSKSAERSDSMVKLNDPNGQQHLDLSLHSDNDDDDYVTDEDTDVTVPKVPYDQNDQFKKMDTGMHNNNSLNDLNRIKMKDEEISNDPNKYTGTVIISNYIKQSEVINYPVYSCNSSSYGHQVESESNIEKAQCCNDHGSYSKKNANSTISFCCDSQLDCKDASSKPMKNDSIEDSYFQPNDHYQQIHQRENFTDTVSDSNKEIKSFYKCDNHSFHQDMMSSIYRSLIPDMMHGHFQQESLITLEIRNHYENEDLLSLSSLALKHTASQKGQESLEIDGNLSENDDRKVLKQKFKFSGKASNLKNKHGRKVSSSNAEKRKYNIVMNHCKRFFRRMNRYRRKRRIREVISSRYVNIYDCNERSDYKGTVFPFYNNGNHNPSDLHGGEQNGYATAEVAMERVRNRHTTLETRAVNSISDSLSSYFQRMSEQQPMSTVEKMQFEWLRLQSFSTFPSSSGVSPILLAKWGYFATGVGDETMTFCCEQRHRNWQIGDDPQAIHRQQSPSCSFILGIGHSNVPVHDIRPRRNLPDSVQESTSQTGSSQIPNGVLPNSQSASALPNQAGPVTSTPDSAAVVARSAPSQQRNEHTARATQSANQSGAVNGTALPGAAYHTPENRSNGSGVDSTHRGSATQSRNDTLGIYFEKPRYPNYAVLAIRVSSFGGWPSYLSQTPREMSLAGFFYAGYGDYVRCFFCGGGLRNWDSGDDPWVEHARWFPKCAFVRQNRGEAFVDLVLKRHAELAQSQQNQANQQPQQTVDNTQQNSTDDMSTPAALSIIEMGFSEDTVRAAILEFKRRKPQGRQNFTAPELLEIVLNEQYSQGENAANSRQQQNASVEPQTPSGPSEQSTLHTRQQPEASATTQQQASAATPKTKDQKSKSEKKKKKKEQAAEKQKPKEQEKASQKTTEQKKSEDAQSQVRGQGVQAEAEATNDRFSSMRVSDSLDQMTLEEVKSLQEENAQLREQTICKICMDKNVSVAFLPCGHLACCDDCAPAMRTCPICRQLVKGTVKTYLV